MTKLPYGQIQFYTCQGCKRFGVLFDTTIKTFQVCQCNLCNNIQQMKQTSEGGKVQIKWREDYQIHNNTKRAKEVRSKIVNYVIDDGIVIGRLENTNEN